MLSHTRALLAATAYAAKTGRKVAGIYDFAADRHLRIAVECQGAQLQGVDGDRAVRFAGTLPEIYEFGAQAFFSLEVDAQGASGYDRGSQEHYKAAVSGQSIQLYDYGAGDWFAYEAQVAEGGSAES